MFELICCIIALVAAIISAYYSYVCKKDRDKYIKLWLESDDRNSAIINKWGETIRLCDEVNDNCGTVIELNKMLRNKIEEKENAQN